jgi:hypothetical protein
MLDTSSAPPQVPPRDVRGTRAAHVIGALGLILAVLCLALLASSIAFWSER